LRVAITGATGFIGSNIARKLCSEGHTVKALVRTEPKIVLGFPYQTVNFLDLNSLTQALAGFDAVVHCAGMIAFPGDQKAMHTANVTITENLATAAIQNKVRCFVHLSTPSVYFNFCDRLNIQELEPVPYPCATLYAETKLQADKVILNLGTKGMRTVILRPRAVSGAGDHHVLPRLLESRLGPYFPLVDGGRALFDMTHIEDFVEVVRLMLERDQISGVFNVSGGQPITSADLVKLLCKEMGIAHKTLFVPYRLARSVSQITEFFSHYTREKSASLSPYTVGLMKFSQTLSIEKLRRELSFVPQRTPQMIVADFVRGLKQDSRI
jgi:nucleoside-diphosphate-sugar epimerase